jgi:hypothetical protein
LPWLTAGQYAIRPSIRNHNTLHRSDVIKQTASLVADSHKVDLTKPDKVIIVDVFQVRIFPHQGRGSVYRGLCDVAFLMIFYFFSLLFRPSRRLTDY